MKQITSWLPRWFYHNYLIWQNCQIYKILRFWESQYGSKKDTVAAFPQFHCFQNKMYCTVVKWVVSDERQLGYQIPCILGRFCVCVCVCVWGGGVWLTPSMSTCTKYPIRSNALLEGRGIIWIYYCTDNLSSDCKQNSMFWDIHPQNTTMLTGFLFGIDLIKCQFLRKNEFSDNNVIEVSLKIENVTALIRWNRPNSYVLMPRVNKSW